MNDHDSLPPLTKPALAPTLAPTLEPASTVSLREHALELAAVFFAGVCVMNFLYAARGGVNGDYPAVPGFDSFYHIKMAMLLPKLGLIHKFPWLTTTIFAEKFISHHYGFHVLLAVFIKLSQWFGSGDPLQGGRWAITFCFGVVTLAFDALLITGRVRYRPLWWLMFLVMPYQFFGRHVFVRAICPSLAFLLLTVLAMFRRRYVLTGLLIFLYIQLYLGAVLYTPLVVVAYCAASWWAPDGDRVSWKLPIYSFVGWLAGLMLHPYGGWDAVEFLRLQVLGTGLTPDILVGREWKSYTPAWYFVEMSAATLGLLAISICARLRCGPRLDARGLSLLVVNFAFLGLTLKARRFIEYWPLLSLLSSAYLLTPVLSYQQKPVTGDRRSSMTIWATSIGTAIVFTIAAALTVTIAPKLGIEPFVAEWSMWLFVLAGLLVAPSVAWAAGGKKRSPIAIALWAGAIGTASILLIVGVVAWAFHDAKLSGITPHTGWWWLVCLLLMGAYALASWQAARRAPCIQHVDSQHAIPKATTLLFGSAGVGLLAMLVAAGPLVAVQRSTRCGFRLADVRDAMNYLKDNSAKDDIVFTDDWDVFGLYFYHNHHNRYIVGLDPKFTHARDPVLWSRYVAITHAKTPTTVNAPENEPTSSKKYHSTQSQANARKGGKQPSPRTKRLPVRLTDIRDHFNAKWVIVDYDHRALARKLDTAPKFAKRVHTVPSNAKPGKERYIIYQILPR